MIESLQRIRIIGGAGSGKTYLAELVSHHTNLSYLNLDDLYWYKGSKRDSKLRDELLEKTLKTEEWVIEGSYDQEWVRSTFVDATMILVLKPSLLLRLFRVFRSYFSRLFRKDNISLRQFISRIRSTIAYNSVHLRPLLSQPHISSKAVVFSRADDAYAYFVKETAPDLFL